MGTLPEWWTGPYPEVSSVQSATDYLDGLGAAINRREEDGSWMLLTGNQELITADTSDELDSFVLGFALAHLICERHGLIGQRSGPQPMPHPADLEDAGPAPLDKDKGEGDGGDGGDEGDGGDGDGGDGSGDAESGQSDLAEAGEASAESDEERTKSDEEERQSD